MWWRVAGGGVTPPARVLASIRLRVKGKTKKYTLPRRCSGAPAPRRWGVGGVGGSCLRRPLPGEQFDVAFFYLCVNSKSMFPNLRPVFPRENLPGRETYYSDVILDVTAENLKRSLLSGVDASTLGPGFHAGNGLSLMHALGFHEPGSVLFYLKSRRIVEVSVINALYKDTFPYSSQLESSVSFNLRRKDFMNIRRSETLSGLVERDENGNLFSIPFYVDGSYYAGASPHGGTHRVKKSWLDSSGDRHFEYGRRLPDAIVKYQTEFCIVPLMRVHRTGEYDPLFMEEGELSTSSEEGELNPTPFEYNYRWTQLKPIYIYNTFFKECWPINAALAFDENERDEIARAVQEVSLPFQEFDI